MNYVCIYKNQTSKGVCSMPWCNLYVRVICSIDSRVPLNEVCTSHDICAGSNAECRSGVCLCMANYYEISNLCGLKLWTLLIDVKSYFWAKHIKARSLRSQTESIERSLFLSILFSFLNKFLIITCLTSLCPWKLMTMNVYIKRFC